MSRSRDSVGMRAYNLSTRYIIYTQMRYEQYRPLVSEAEWVSHVVMPPVHTPCDFNHLSASETKVASDRVHLLDTRQLRFLKTAEHGQYARSSTGEATH